MSGVPEVTRAFEIFTTANGIPITGRVHALAAVVGSGPKIFGPEEFFSRLINQHRVVSDGAAVVVQIVRALSVGIVGATFGGQIAFVVDGEMVLIKMVVLGEVGTRIEFNPGRVGPEPITHDQVTNSPKEVVAGNLGVVCVSWIPRDNVLVIPQKLSNGNAVIFARRPSAVAQDPGGKWIFETIDRI